MIEEKKICVKCGGDFMIHTVQQRRKKYCSYECSNTYVKTGKKTGRPRKNNDAEIQRNI